MLRATLAAVTIGLGFVSAHLAAEAYESSAEAYEDANSAYTRHEFAKAAELYGLAADQGHAEAQFRLGFMYAFGDGIEQDKVLAHKLFNLAATQGHELAKYNRFLIAYRMTAAEIADAQRQAKDAVSRMSDAAPGLTNTMESASAAYERQDYGDAIAVFHNLAGRGVAAAQYRLGQMYLAGEGVPQHFAEAANWLDRAADQGHAEAQFRLGFMYAFGAGVDHDKVLAHKFLDLSALQGNELAQFNRSLVAFGMTPEEIAEARRLAEEWLKKRE